MRRKSPITIAIFVLLMAAGLVPHAGRAQTAELPDPTGTAPTSWWLAFRTNGYFYKVNESNTGTQEDRFDLYQTYNGSVSGLWKDRLSLRLSGRYASAWLYPPVETNKNRLLVGYAQLKVSTWRSKLRLGRVFLQEGPANFTMSGLWLDLHPHRRWNVKLWGGSRADANLDWGVDKLSERGTYGARLIGTLRSNLRLGFSWAYWKDQGVVAAQPLGIDGTWLPIHGLRTFGRFYYDVEQEAWARTELLAQYQSHRSSPWLYTGQYVGRQPYILQSSYFSRFSDLAHISLARASVRYLTPKGLGGEVEWYGGFIDSESSNRLGLIFHAPYARLGYTLLGGFSGEQSRFWGDIWLPLKDWGELSAGLMLETYALMQDAPADQERELVTMYARYRMRVASGVRFTAWLQSLENPRYQHDTRLVLGLDLLMGGGASQFGLGRGGWLK